MASSGTPRRSRLSEWWWELTYRVGPNLWVIPLLMGACSVVLFVVTRRLDGVAADALVDHEGLPEWLLARSAADADIVLTAFLGALAAALALVFSTTVLTFSLATSQLGPRLIRRFMQDPVTQVTLGLFLSAVVVCALTLGSVRAGVGPSGVPAVSYGYAVLLGLSCFVALVVYIHRVAVTIQAPNVVASVVHALDESLDEQASLSSGIAESTDAEHVAAVVAGVRSTGAVVVASSSGFVQAVDHLRIVDATEDHDAVVVMVERVGQFIVEGRPLAVVTPPDAASEMDHVLRHAVEIGPARTRRQDVEYAINQVVEIAIRALSPAVNDTFTGMLCVDWLGAALCRIGQDPPSTGGILGRDGSVRVYLPPIEFERMLRAAFDLVRQAGAANPAITIRLLDSVGVAATMVRPEHLPALGRVADQVLASGLATGPVGQDEIDVVERHRRATETIGEREAAT